jgi:hypothetical protein
MSKRKDEFSKSAAIEKIRGFNVFMEEIGKHIIKRGILTFTSKLRGEVWDVKKKEDGTLRFGVNEEQSLLFPARFISILSEDEAIGVILRTFLSEKDEFTGHPVKELRGYFVQLENNRIKLEQLSAENLMNAENLDANTGKTLPPEKGVVYCGPNGERIDATWKYYQK